MATEPTVKAHLFRLKTALALLFGLVVSGQIRLRRLDGWRQIPAVLRERRQAAA